MSAKTKIVVLRMKELIYAGIFAAIGLFLIVLLILLFIPDKDRTEAPLAPAATDAPPTAMPSALPSPDVQSPEPRESAPAQAGILQENLPAASYIPGIYKTELILGGQCIEVEAVLEKDRITSLRLVNLDEAVTTMYPLLQPTMDNICKQVYESQSINHITYDPGAKYTSLVLLEAIKNCLEKGTDAPD